MIAADSTSDLDEDEDFPQLKEIVARYREFAGKPQAYEPLQDEASPQREDVLFVNDPWVVWAAGATRRRPAHLAESIPAECAKVRVIAKADRSHTDEIRAFAAAEAKLRKRTEEEEE